MSNLLKTQMTFESEALCHREALFGHALKLTKNPKDAEDLLQDTFMRSYRHFDKYQPGTNCKAWLFKIMTNEYINQYRHNQRERLVLDRDEALSENITDAKANPFSDESYDVQSGDFRDEVSYALNTVPEDFRAIVVMADLQDQSYKEISEQLEIPIGTVMSRLFRGRQILRKKLKTYAETLGVVR